MKKNFTLLFCVLFSVVTLAQNLVVNPSFEQTTSNCGSFGGEGFFTDLSGSWSNASNNAAGDSCSSPDLFSACNIIFGNPSPMHMPNSVLGYQRSRTGTRHAGIITHESMSQYREYIQGHTSSPMQAGVSYCVSMYVSLANDVPFATNNMGVYFTNSPYLRNPCPGTTNSLINVTPQLNYNCAPITDTTANWFRLQWNYVATGGEQYFTIGNFFNNANTNIVTVGSNLVNPYAYYFIDDVSIEATTACCYADVSPSQVVCVSDAAFNFAATGGVGSSCSGTVTGTWSGTGITNATSGTFSPGTAGVGSHTLTFSMSCGFSTTTTVVVQGCATLSVCVEANGDLTVSGGEGPYTWFKQVEGLDCSACTNMFPLPPCEFPPGCAVAVLEWSEFATGVAVTPPATFPLRVVDNTGGVIEIAGVATLPQCAGSNCELDIALISSNDVCSGIGNGAATVAATGNIGMVMYSWNTNPTQFAATASGLEAGEYTVTATDKQGCVATLTVVIATETVVANAGDDVVVCKGNAANLTATGGVNYVWNNGAGTGATVTVMPGQTTVYTVTATGSGGCADSDEVTVTVTETPVVSFETVNTTLCDTEGPLQLGASPLGGTYSGAGVSGSTFNPSVAGVGEHIITYEYYDEPECPGSDQITLTVDLCTDVTDAETLEGLLVHPNPSSGMFTIEYTGNLTGAADVVVTDVTGRTVMTLHQNELSGMRIPLNITSLTNGHYLLHINQNGKRLNVTRLTKR